MDNLYSVKKNNNNGMENLKNKYDNLTVAYRAQLKLTREGGSASINLGASETVIHFTYWRQMKNNKIANKLAIINMTQESTWID